MKYIFVSIFVLFGDLNAYTLQEILQLQKDDNKVKSIEAMRDAQIAQNSLVASYQSPRMSAKVAHAKEPNKEGLEYALGISQNILNPFDSSAKNSASGNLSDATRQEARHALHLRELDIASKYYGACSSQALQLKSKSLFEEQKQRVEKLKSAYELGEISKKELIFSRLSLAKLHRNASSYERAYVEDFASLQKSVGDLVVESIACDDMIEPKRELKIKDVSEHGELQRLEYQKNAANAMYELYASPIQNIGYELLYEQEIQTQRYSLGINMPLGFASSQQELLKEQALKTNTAYFYAKESLKNEINTTATKLLKNLKVIYDEYKLLKNEILPLSKELLELSQYAYAQGEGTLMEYLDSSQSYAQNGLETLEIKKTYYYELFEFYKITDREYGEEICIK